MLRMLRADGRTRAYPLAGLLVLGLATAACAEHKPLTKEEQDKVDKAIDKGVAFLKRAQTAKGNWTPQRRGALGTFLVGECALPAYALLESGVPPDDPVVQKAAAFLREQAPKKQAIKEEAPWRGSRTYDMALALLFFDRLGEAKDEPLIRTLAARLIAGQRRDGGWNYLCLIPTKAQEDALLAALTEMEKRREAGEKSYDRLMLGIKLPRGMDALPVLLNPRSLPWRRPSNVGDNSNTQFAMLGLWAAQRHGVPVQASFRLLVERFERSQLPTGRWSYRIVWHPDKQFNSPAMTCAGLMGLAIGRGLKLERPDGPRPTEWDARIVKGLAAMRQDMGESIIAPVNEADGDALSTLYVLWSVERVSMLYDLPVIGDKDWYRWGARGLLLAQQPQGEWNLAYSPTVDTAFALLILKRSHPMKELTAKLPLTGKELNQGIARLRPGSEFPVRDGEPSASSRSSEPITTTPSAGKKPPR